MKQLYALIARLINWIGSPLKVLIVKNSHRVRVLVRTNDSILLLKSSIGSQKWSLPGGGIKKNEPAHSAARREVKEETNLDLTNFELKDLGQQALPIKGTSYHFYARFYSAQLPEQLLPKIIRPFEILEVKWFKLDNLPDDRSPTVDIAILRTQTRQHRSQSN